MSKYINIDTLECDTEWDDYNDSFISYSKFQIEHAPSIDIILCKHCEYGKEVNIDNRLEGQDLWCEVEKFPVFTQYNGFCHKGKIKEE